MRRFIPLLLCVFLVSSTIAQQAPPPPAGEPEGGGDLQDGRGPGPGGPGGGPGQRPDGPRGGGPGGGFGGPGMGMGRPPHPGGPGMPPPPPMSDRMKQVEMLRGYLELVDRYTQMSSNPTNAGIAAVITANDILKSRGADAAIEYFTKLLPDVKDAAVQRAIRVQLADLYKNSNQGDKALEQLRALMTSEAPAAKPAQ